MIPSSHSQYVGVHDNHFGMQTKLTYCGLGDCFLAIPSDSVSSQFSGRDGGILSSDCATS